MYRVGLLLLAVLTLPSLLDAPVLGGQRALAQADPAGWTPEVRAVLEEAKRACAAPAEGASQPIAIFDFDNTLILGDVTRMSTLLQAEQKLFRFDTKAPNGLLRASGTSAEALMAAAFARYKSLKKVRYEDALEFLAQLLQGLTVDEARALGRDAITRGEREPLCRRSFRSDGGDEVSVAWGTRVRTQLKTLISELETAGCAVWVVSASPQPLVAGAAEHFGIPPERVLGVRTEVEEGRLTATLVPPVTYREGKVTAVRERLNQRPVLVVGDAWTDYEMLILAERGVLMDTNQSAELASALTAHDVVVQPPFGTHVGLPTCPAAAATGDAAPATPRRAAPSGRAVR